MVFKHFGVLIKFGFNEFFLVENILQIRKNDCMSFFFPQKDWYL